MEMRLTLGRGAWPIRYGIKWEFEMFGLQQESFSSYR